MCCCVRFSSLPHGFELWEYNIHNQGEPSNDEFVMSMVCEMPFIQKSTLDPMPPWGTLLKLQALVSCYIHQASHILSSPSPQLFANASNGPLGLNPLDTKVIQWHIPKDGTCLFELFGDVNSSLAIILQYDIKI